MVVVMAAGRHRRADRARRRARRERRRRGLRQQGRHPHDHRPGRRHRVLPPPQPAQHARRRRTCTGSPTPTSWSAASTTPSGRPSGSARRATRCRSAPTRSRSSPARAPSRAAQQTLEAARMAQSAGATILRGGAFKPRTSPYAFQGLGMQGLEILADVREATGHADRHRGRRRPRRRRWSRSTPTCSRSAPATWPTSGCSRRSASAGKPVLLKRGMTATIEEWLMAAEYVAQRGNLDVVLCERGIRTFEPATRNTLDISAVPVVQATSHLPIIVDPSHAAGRRDLVVPLARAADRRRRRRRRSSTSTPTPRTRSATARRRCRARPARARPGGAQAPAGRGPGRRGATRPHGG